MRRFQHSLGRDVEGHRGLTVLKSLFKSLNTHPEHLGPYESYCAQNGNKVILDQADLNSKHEIRNSKQSQMTKL
jgi:hypothetical protein